MLHSLLLHITPADALHESYGAFVLLVWQPGRGMYKISDARARLCVRITHCVTMELCTEFRTYDSLYHFNSHIS